MLNEHTLNSSWRPILMYHRVSDEPDPYGLAVTPSVFDRQLAFLKRRGYQGVTLADFYQRVTTGKSIRKLVVITFDDGYEDNYTQAWPILKKYGFAATIFLVSDFIGGSSNFDQAATVFFPILQKSQITQMAAGGIEFGSHSCTHRPLPNLTANEKADELGRSRRDLSDLLGREVVSFAYPYSKIDEASREAVAEAGYEVAVAGSGATFTRYQLNRIDPTQSSLASLTVKMSPTVRRVRQNSAYVKARSLVHRLRHR